MYPLQAPADRREFDLREYLLVLRRRWASVVVVVLIVVALAAILSYRKTPVYESTAAVLLRPDAMSSFLLPNGGSNDAERRVENEAQLILGVATRQEVADRLGYNANVSVDADGDTDVIDIIARDPSAAEAAKVANTYAEAHADVRQQQAVAELQETQEEIEAQIADIQTQIDSYQQTINDAQTQLQDPALPPEERARLEEVVNDTTQLRDGTLQSQGTFEQNLGNVQVTQQLASNQPPLEILAPASAPTTPVSPDHREDLTVALVLGLLFGIGWAFVREHLDDSVRDTNDIDAATGGLAQLGVIPKIRGLEEEEAPSIVTASAPMSHAAEAYRALRTSVEFIGLDSRIHTIQVTSASAGEGKTATLVNLGVAFAQAGERVALLDCDLRRPRLHEYFSLDRERGFTSVLLGGASLADIVQPVDGFDHLDVVCSGTLPPNPSELLREDRFAELVEELVGNHTIVLIDSPPVLPVTDALVLSRVTDATLFVAASGITSKRRVRRAVASLRQVSSPLMGYVLNQAPTDVAYGYVDYSYAYYGNRPTNGNGKRRPKDSGDRGRGREADRA